MNAEDYLTRLRTSLKGLQPQQQAELIDEIAAHLSEAGEGNQPRPLEAEMGAPEDLGRRLKHVHRPDRWLDYLLIVGPEIVLFPLLTALTVIMTQLLPLSADGPLFSQPPYYWNIRVSLLLHAVLVWVSFRRGFERGSTTNAAALLVYWLMSIWWVLFALCYRERRWQPGSDFNLSVTGLFESLLLTLALVGLSLWLLRLLIRARDPLLAALALLPCAVAVGNLGVGQLIASGSFPNGYPFPNWHIGYLGPIQIAQLIWPALFFLFAQRPVKWLGLLANAAPLALMNLVASARYPHLLALWSLPILLVLAGWLLDWRTHRRSIIA